MLSRYLIRKVITENQHIPFPIMASTMEAIKAVPITKKSNLQIKDSHLIKEKQNTPSFILLLAW